MKKFKIRRRMNNRMIAGVCSAVADGIGVDPLWIRLGFIGGGIMGFPWIFLMYFIGALIIPKDDTEVDLVIEEYKRVYRIKENEKIGGVCTGLQEYFGIDVVAIRLLFILSAFMGFGILLYLILWMITPQYKPQLTTA